MDDHASSPASDWRTRLARAIDHAAHLLPAQGPITVFIHHNTLHAFEDLPFEKAVVRGGAAFGCEPFLSEVRYRAELGRGRIRFADLRAVLSDDLGDRATDSINDLATKLELRLAMLEYPPATGPAAELAFVLAETDAFRRVRPDVAAVARRRLISETRHWVMRDIRGRTGPDVPAWMADLFARFGTRGIEAWSDDTWEAFAVESLWRVCLDGVGATPLPRTEVRSLVRHRDFLLAVTGTDPDLWVHDSMARVCAAFLDQGVSHWPLPDRADGIYLAFLRLYARPGGPPAAWLRGLRTEATRLLDGAVAPLDSVHESLTQLGVPAAEWDEYLSATLLALRGWGGIIYHIEERGDRVALPVPAGSLIEFLAVRLLLDRLAVTHAAATAGFAGPLADLRAELRRRLPPADRPALESRAYLVFQLAQVFGWSPDALHRLTPGEWALLVHEVEGFTNIERRRVFHLAYERRFRDQSLDAVSLHPPHRPPPNTRPKFQVITCIDEREESFRRHLEEVAPACETFGLAGFFGVAMYYRGAAAAQYVPLCPVVIRPQHWVEEQATDADASRRWTWARWAAGAVSHRFHVGTRSVAAGAVLTGGLGALAAIPLVARVMFPRLAAAARRRLGRVVKPPAQTRLTLERTAAAPGPDAAGLGYSLAEMTAIADRQLGDAGLSGDRFAKLVLVLGHGSHSTNNPHESAHDCGACGGSVGGPNGRALAQILNDPRVREGLAKLGRTIPADTVFVGGLHNTCNEYVKFADKDRLPASHRELFHEAEAAIEATLARNAHERARRFESAALSLSPEAARRHMDARAEDLAQVRPEWGHATNALCVVGRRDRTRGLYLDRRAFLTSYDPTRDGPDSPVLARILAAAVPVCAGINLEYYFCHTDPTGYGCGTKLPHNITSLIGVMDGAASDLRTGLPWQMVEIHEPVRLLFIIETTPAVMLGIMARNPTIDILVRNGWVQMSVLDPYSNRVQVYRDGAFRPHEPPPGVTLPLAASSVDWYRGWRDHLEFATIGERNDA